MGINDIWEKVKLIPGLPDKIFRTLKWRIDSIRDRIKELEPEKLIILIQDVLNDTIKPFIEKMGDAIDDRFDAIQETFVATIDNIRETVEDIPKTVKTQLETVKEWIAEMYENVKNPLEKFIGNVWDRVLPWLVGIIAVVLFPVYGPMLMGVARILF